MALDLELGYHALSFLLGVGVGFILGLSLGGFLFGRDEREDG